MPMIFVTPNNHLKPCFTRGESDLITTDRNLERIEDYVAGGFPPVHLYDIYEERYYVMRKLGHGLYGTVWLAKDTRFGFSSVVIAIKLTQLMQS